MLLAISVANAALGWALIGIGGLFVIVAAIASALEAFRTALNKNSGAALAAKKIEWPWDKVFDLLKEVVNGLMGKTGGPLFFMGLLVLAAGIVVLNEQPL